MYASCNQDIIFCPSFNVVYSIISAVKNIIIITTVGGLMVTRLKYLII